MEDRQISEGDEEGGGDLFQDIRLGSIHQVVLANHTGDHLVLRGT